MGDAKKTALDEEWRVTQMGDVVSDTEGTPPLVATVPEGDDRAALVALAPEMARALLEMEWQGSDGYPMCPECGVFEKDGVHRKSSGRICALGALCDKLRTIAKAST